MDMVHRLLHTCVYIYIYILCQCIHIDIYFVLYHRVTKMHSVHCHGNENGIVGDFFRKISDTSPYNSFATAMYSSGSLKTNYLDTPNTVMDRLGPPCWVQRAYCQPGHGARALAYYRDLNIYQYDFEVRLNTIDHNYIRDMEP